MCCCCFFGVERRKSQLWQREGRWVGPRDNKGPRAVLIEGRTENKSADAQTRSNNRDREKSGEGTDGESRRYGRAGYIAAENWGAKQRAGSVAKTRCGRGSVMQRQGFSYARDGRLWLRQIARRTSERETNVECGGPGRFSWPEGRVSASRLRSRSPYSIPVSLSSVRCQQIKAPAARPVRALTASHRGSQKGQKPAKTTNVEKWGNRTTKRGGKQNRTRLTLGGGRVGAVVRGEELAEERLCMASGACGLALSPAICIRPMRCALDGLFRKHSERAPFELACTTTLPRPSPSAARLFPCGFLVALCVLKPPDTDGSLQGFVWPHLLRPLSASVRSIRLLFSGRSTCLRTTW